MSFFSLSKRVIRSLPTLKEEEPKKQDFQKNESPVFFSVLPVAGFQPF